jgi:primosomal protein N' (replication factor Y)
VTDDIPSHIIDDLFLGLAEIDWEDAKESPLFPELLRLKESGKVDIRYEVNTKNKVKTKRVVKKNMTNELLLVERESIRKNATQKLRLLAFLLEIEEEEFGVTELIENFEIA